MTKGNRPMIFQQLQIRGFKYRCFKFCIGYLKLLALLFAIQHRLRDQKIAFEQSRKEHRFFENFTMQTYDDLFSINITWCLSIKMEN